MARSVRDFTHSGMKYGALAGFVSAELEIGRMAAFYALGGVLGYGPATPDMGIALFLSGQLIGALPATILGALLGGWGGFLFGQFPALSDKGRGILWGILYALSVYLLPAGLGLLVGNQTFADYELLTVFYGYIKTPHHVDRDFLLSLLGGFILYLGAGAWGGSKLAKLARAQ